MFIGDLFEAKLKPLTTDSPEFRRWFAGSKVVDAHGNPQPVFHGAARPDRIGTQFRKSRATAGPMAYFTDSAAIASNYAMGKEDTSNDAETDYENWFWIKIPGFRKEISLSRAWHFLTPDERATLERLAPRVRENDEEEIELGDERVTNGLGNYQYALRSARGNVLAALIDGWLVSGALFDDEGEFLKVLRLAGLQRPVRLFDPRSKMPAVYKVFLCIRKPLVSTAIPADVLQALQAVGQRQRSRASPYEFGWDKNKVNPREWLGSLLDDVESSGGVNSWTVIPDWVTQVLEKLGYDGIKDVGGKNTQSYDHTVWIPFHEWQVKSAISNTGYDSAKRNIHR